MCGIVGSVSTKTNIIPILLDGLKTLEYRGYDSAGLSYIKDGNLIINKVKGRVKDLEEHISKESNANIGIAHTRWATHGKVNETNAHPHNVGNVTIVHNGIIENFNKLKHKLEDKGYKFKSEADTEIAAGLLDYYYKKYENIDKAIQKFMKKVDGSYAICMIINDNPNTIYVIKKDSPLIIGTGYDTNYIASDVPAILKYTKNYYILEDYEYGKVTANNITIYDKEGNILNKQLKEYQGSDLTSDKGIYEHYMLKEIMEQSATIRKTVNPYINSLDDLLKLPDLIKYERIDIIACGTAMHAGLAAKYLFEEYTNTKCEVFLASEYRYQNNFLNNKVLSIFISQSGETADTLAALKKVKEANCDTLGIVNVKESSIARALDKVLYTKAGTEIAVASTKAYTAQVALLSTLALAHAYRTKSIKEEKILKILEEFRGITSILNEVLEDTKTYENIAKEIYEKSDVFYIGRGLDYALAMEGSLKLKEISYIHSEAYAAGELKHGTISLITKDTPVFASATNKHINAKTISNLKEVIARGANCYLITDEDIKDDSFKQIIQIKKVSMFLKPLLTIIPYQLIAYYTAKLKGCDIDKPRNLAKSVTVE